MNKINRLLLGGDFYFVLYQSCLRHTIYVIVLELRMDKRKILVAEFLNVPCMLIIQIMFSRYQTNY